MPSSWAACRRRSRMRSMRSPPWDSSTRGTRAYPISSSTGSIWRRSWTGLSWVGVGGHLLLLSRTRGRGSSLSPSPLMRAMRATPPANARKGTAGRPGRRARPARNPEAIHAGLAADSDLAHYRLGHPASP